MPCTSERDRKDDKYTAWENAYADWIAARNLALAADAAMATACIAAILTGGGGGFTAAACAAAVAALATALANASAASDKSNIAKSAYDTAFGNWQDCMAKLH